MIGLFDRDVFFKLCCCDLWTEALFALGITQPFRLASTSSERSNRRAISGMLRGQDPESAIDRAKAALAMVPVLSDDLVEGIESTEEFEALGTIDGIDAGEQQLAAILLRQAEDHIMISGDKRFVRAFRDGLPAEWDKIKGSVISFEACLLAVEAAYGFELLVERAFSARCCDGTLKLALGDPPYRENFVRAMTSYDPCREGPGP